MAIVSALLSLLSRQLGQILRAVFGWSVTGLFGRLSQSKQTALSAALLLALAWPLLIAGVFAPQIAAWAVALVPLHRWVNHTVLRIVWLTFALVAPIAVGAIVRSVAPGTNKRSLPATLLYGYPVTLGLCAAFVITLGVVPVLKLGALFKRWQDEHVYVQVQPGAYTAVLDAVREACRKVGIETADRAVPKPMLLPVRVLKFFTRGGLDPVVANDPRMLKHPSVELYLYPADLLLRGEKSTVARVRSALLRELVHAPAHLTEDPEAQKIELELGRLWDVVARHQALAESPSTDGAKDRLRAIAHKIDHATVPYQDWVLLYTNAHHLERAICGGPRLVDHDPVQLPPPPPRHPVIQPVAQMEAVMMQRDLQRDSRANDTTADLVQEAIEEARTLFKTEFALAREEMHREVTGFKRSVILFGVAGMLTVLGLVNLLIAWALAIAPHALPALVVALALLGVAGVAAFVGVASLPKKAPLTETRERLETDLHVLKETTA